MKYFIFNGPTASGKSVLLDFLIHHNNDFLEPVISFTTRSPRNGERHGKDYYFISSKEYLELQKTNQIVEQIKYLNCYYGVSRQELQRVESTQKNGVAIMTLEGIRKFKRNVGYQKVINIFMYRDLTDVFNSINDFGYSPDEAAKRMERAKLEMREISAGDYVLYNTSSISDAVQQLLPIIKKEINSHPLEKDIKPGQQYRHYSGEIYEIVCDLAEHTETLSPMVIYRSLATGRLFARPYELFCGKKEWPPTRGNIVNRFELVKPEVQESSCLPDN